MSKERDLNQEAYELFDERETMKMGVDDIFSFIQNPDFTCEDDIELCVNTIKRTGKQFAELANKINSLTRDLAVRNKIDHER